MSIKTILVVDDESDVRQYLETIFKDAGYNVVTGDNGLDAVTLAENENPDLITLDITMPEESGVKAYKTLKQNVSTKDIPVIIITGYDDPNFERFISTRKTAPAPEAFFDKPIKREDLLAKTKEILG